MNINRDIISGFHYFNDDFDDAVLLSELSADTSEGHNAKKRRKYVNRNFAKNDQVLYDDYFALNSRYSGATFKRRFRMEKVTFMKICDALAAHNPFFQTRIDAAKRRGLSTYQKVTAALRLLAYGNAADALDEYLKIGESTALDILRKFTENIIEIYGERYLRSPTEEDVRNLMKENAARGFPGMIGSIDCMHWVWRNCPVAYKGQYQGKEGKPTLVLEAVASYDLHIWHCFFGLPGSLNDINVLDRSPFVDAVINEQVPKVPYTIKTVTRDTPYFLADGIYPDWPIFMKTISDPSNQKTKAYAKRQESVRKDVERAFGVLQSQWLILSNPGRLWDVCSMSSIVKTCIILHNMNVEHNKSTNLNVDEPPIEQSLESEVFVPLSSHVNAPPKGTFAWLVAAREKVKNAHDYFELRNALIEYIWDLEGDV